VVFTLLAAAPWRQLPAFANLQVFDPAYLPIADKTNLTPLRLLDALAKFWLLAVLIDRGAAWLASRPSRLLVLAGRHSLPVFVLGLVLSTISAVIIRETGYVMAVQVLVVVAGSALMVGFAAMLDWQARFLKQDTARRGEGRAEALAASPATIEAPAAQASGMSATPVVVAPALLPGAHGSLRITSAGQAPLGLVTVPPLAEAPKN
jgi:hypothetical protein